MTDATGETASAPEVLETMMKKELATLLFLTILTLVSVVESDDGESLPLIPSSWPPDCFVCLPVPCLTALPEEAGPGTRAAIKSEGLLRQYVRSLLEESSLMRTKAGCIPYSMPCMPGATCCDGTECKYSGKMMTSICAKK